MRTPSRIAFLHTGAVVIPPVAALAAELIPEAAVVNYLDDRIVADLGDPTRAASVPARIRSLVAAAAAGGADVVMLTCSSISGFAAQAASEVGIPVLRIDEAMADAAVSAGGRIAVVATLDTTLRPTIALLEERARRAGASPKLTSEVVPGAFAAVTSGDRAQHDRLVAAVLQRVAPKVDVIVLAQASMASAAGAVDVGVAVLTSLRPGVERLRDVLAG